MFHNDLLTAVKLVFVYVFERLPTSTNGDKINTRFSQIHMAHRLERQVRRRLIPIPSMLRKMDRNALHQAVPVVEGRKIVAKSQLDSSLSGLRCK